MMPEALLPPGLQFSVIPEPVEVVAIQIREEGRFLGAVKMRLARRAIQECLVNLDQLRQETARPDMGLAVVLTANLHYGWRGKGLGAALYAKAAQVAWEMWGAALGYNVCLIEEGIHPSTSPAAFRVWRSQKLAPYIISATAAPAPVVVWRGCIARGNPRLGTKKGNYVRDKMRRWKKEHGE